MDNNNNLIVNFHPFMIQQEIDVYQDGACVKQDFVTIEEVVDKIRFYCSMYDIPRINLCGNRDFVNKFEKVLRTCYDASKTINVIPR